MSDKLVSTYTYNILALGPSNAGKTTLLASMFHKLGQLNPEEGSTLLTTCDKNRETLEDRYISMARGERIAGTNEISEWEFGYEVWSPYTYKHYPVMGMTYLDYSGGRLIEPQSAGYQVLKKHIKKADILLVLLDGERLFKLMQGRLDVEDFFEVDLRNILQSVLVEGEAPTHFVITKWDILKPKYSLGDLKKRLLENIMFRHFIEGQKRIICLIPVSSFGNEFAKRLPDGTMEKIPGKQPNPYYIEAHVACILIDQFTSQLERPFQAFRERQKSSLQSFLGRRTTLRAIITLFGGLSQFLQSMEAHPMLKAGAITVSMALDFVEHYGESKSKKRKRAREKFEHLLRMREKMLKAVKNQQTATDYAIICCMIIVQRLEEDFPDSFLS